MIKYTIVVSTLDYINLMDKVRDHIADGWEPIGGVSPVYDHNRCEVVYYQAMIQNLQHRR